MITRRIALLMPAALSLQGFDLYDDLPTQKLGGDYQYHTRLRNTVAHPTRDSVELALTLLLNPTAQNAERAERILRRLLPLQVTDPASRWYGLWGWFVEEPPDQMSPADWNWADFMGSVLLMILHYAGGRLPTDLREKIAEAILHAARSIVRRNVDMSYTNIAIKGMFVTRAAGKLLGDRELSAYGDARLSRLKAAVETTGSFAEYGSPPYAQLAMRDLVRARTWIPDERSAWIERRLWLHLAMRWHAPTKQFAGPMSRAYQTQQPRYKWVESGLGLESAAVGLKTEDDVLAWDCPADLRPYFLRLNAPRTHREVFLPAATPGEFVQGTTYLHPDFCLGSANRSDFWNQSAAVIAYAKDSHLRLRLFRESYDFASALVFTVQRENSVLGLINFRNPGGDRHISLDPLPASFQVRKFEVRLEKRGDMPHRFNVQILNGPDFPESTSVTWADFPGLFGYFTLEVFPTGDPSPVNVQVDKSTVRLRWRDLEISGLCKVARAEELDAAFKGSIGQVKVPYVRLAEPT